MTSPIPPLRHPLHVFRAILREASYHPDPAARSYLKSYAGDSFRAQSSKSASHQQWTAEAKWQREVKAMRNARQLHSMLQRCNEGYLGPFRKTLSWTYGRSGRRRRPLMRQIMRIRPHSETPVGESLPPNLTGTSSPALELFDLPLNDSNPDADLPPTGSVVIKAIPSKPQSNTYFSYGPGIPALPARRYRPHNQAEVPPMFQMLSMSQAAASDRIPSQTAGNKPKGPKLPSTTIWGRPMPECRTRNSTLKWFANEAALLYPNLPPEEWAYIRDIARGTIRLTVPARRPTASIWVFTIPDLEPAPSLLAAPRAEPRYQGKKQGNPHRLTQRFLAHQYEWLLRHVPLLVGGEGEAAYGSAPSVPPLATEPQPQDMRSSEEAKLESVESLGNDSATETPERVGVKAAKPTPQKPRPLGSFLWHSTVLDKPKPQKLKPQQLSAQANKLLFG